MEALRALVDQFVTDLQVVIRQEALEAVRGVLGDGAFPARRGPGRPRKAATRGPGRPRKTTKRGPGRPRKTGRRSDEDVSALADQVLAHVRANPGQRLEEIARELGMDTNDLKQPVAKLLAAGTLRRKGKARGTKYYIGGGGKRKAKKAGKRATKRKATKRKATRKAGKKAKAKRAARKAPTKKTRRKLSPEQKAVLVERLAKARAAKQAAG